MKHNFPYPCMDYETYLKSEQLPDNVFNWIEWKVFVCGMSEKEAVLAAISSDWGYNPLPKEYEDHNND